MNKSHPKSIFVCQHCGKESLRWLGHCPQCGEWNSFVETPIKPQSTGASRRLGGHMQELAQVTTEATPRLTLPMREFNRVLGGGIVPGSLTLISGDPGIGKSTLLLQVCGIIVPGKGKVVYISGEESPQQIKLRASRLGLNGDGLYLLAETNLEFILQQLEEVSPVLAVIDSIQTVSLDDIPSAPGSVGQVRECTVRLMHWAKSSGTPLFITGHVTKDGAIAGPRILEHIVDTVLYLEGESFSSYRLLRSVKNRFGSTNEVGIFEMRGNGLVEVENPSQVFLSQRSRETVGSAVVPTLEGTRPLLVEIQALTTTTSFGLPRRTANGVDFGRLLLVTAVLTKRLGLPLSTQDIIVNAAGGLKVSEPAADLGIALCIASSFRDRKIDPTLAAVGEVGLSGELRQVPQLERRLTEVARLGFRHCLIPNSPSVTPPQGLELIGVNSLKEALKGALSRTNVM